MRPAIVSAQDLREMAESFQSRIDDLGVMMGQGPLDTLEKVEKIVYGNIIEIFEDKADQIEKKGQYEEEE